MKSLSSFDPSSFGDTLVALAIAFVLGTLIGLERQYRQRTAGLRTNVLVPSSAASDELDALVAALDARSDIESCSWTVSTTT